MGVGDVRAYAKYDLIIVDIAAESRLVTYMVKKNTPFKVSVMKKIISALALVALMAPSVASAATPAGSLSVKSASVQPVRAAAKSGKLKADAGKTTVILLAVLAAGGAIALITGGSDSK